MHLNIPLNNAPADRLQRLTGAKQLSRWSRDNA
jgi:hypothetical protein